MAARTDLLLLPNGDLPIGAAIMTTGASDLQHQRDMYRSFAGEWKQFPQNGVGLPMYLKGSSTSELELRNKIRQSLKADGYLVGAIEFKFDINGILIVNSETSR